MPGRPIALPEPAPAAGFASATDLAAALRRASAAHEQYEAELGAKDLNWPDWYAAYMVTEQARP